MLRSLIASLQVSVNHSFSYQTHPFFFQQNDCTPLEYTDSADTEVEDLCTIYMNGRKEGNVLFNDALNTLYLRLYGVR